MEKLKDLEFTAADFEMLIEGLDAIPERGVVNDIMGDLISLSLSKQGDEEAKNQIEKAHEERAEKRRLEKEKSTESIRLLKGKLFMFERYLRSNGALG